MKYSHEGSQMRALQTSMMTEVRIDGLMVVKGSRVVVAPSEDML